MKTYTLIIALGAIALGSWLVSDGRWFAGVAMAGAGLALVYVTIRSKLAERRFRRIFDDTEKWIAQEMEKLRTKEAE